MVWLAVVGATAVFAWKAVVPADFAMVVMPLLGLVGGLALVEAVKYWRHPKGGGRFELVAGLWTAALYGGMLVAAVVK